MKKLDELKISPAPWKVGTKCVPRCVMTAHNGIVARGIDEANARLIATAPELYKALREAVIECCHPYTCFGSSDDGYACHGERECFIKRWREVLARAARESEAKE